MKLRNKKTGEIIEFDAILPVKDVSGDSVAHLEYNSLTEFNEEWEDMPEEPKGYWYIRDGGNIDFNLYGKSIIERHKTIGNYFNTREEAEKAVEKLKAWKRLKDKGLYVTTFYVEDGSLVIRAKTHNSSGAENWEDLDLLFGGEE